MAKVPQQFTRKPTTLEKYDAQRSAKKCKTCKKPMSECECEDDDEDEDDAS